MSSAEATVNANACVDESATQSKGSCLAQHGKLLPTCSYCMLSLMHGISS